MYGDNERSLHVDNTCKNNVDIQCLKLYSGRASVLIMIVVTRVNLVYGVNLRFELMSKLYQQCTLLL